MRPDLSQLGTGPGIKGRNWPMSIVRPDLSRLGTGLGIKGRNWPMGRVGLTSTVLIP